MAHPTPRTQRYSALTFLWSQAIKRAMHTESREGASAGSESALHDRPAATVSPIAYPWNTSCLRARARGECTTLARPIGLDDPAVMLSSILLATSSQIAANSR